MKLAASAAQRMKRTEWNMAASWLNDAVFYEIYPQSFYDSNGDGIGDIPGIIEKLDYVKSLGCNALWINPCFDSPFKDAGYDVRDYKRVAPGTVPTKISSTSSKQPMRKESGCCWTWCQATPVKSIPGSKPAARRNPTSTPAGTSGPTPGSPGGTECPLSAEKLPGTEPTS